MPKYIFPPVLREVNDSLVIFYDISHPLLNEGFSRPVMSLCCFERAISGRRVLLALLIVEVDLVHDRPRRESSLFIT